MEDMYGGAAASATQQDYFPVDDLLDFSNNDLFSSSAATSSADTVELHTHSPPPPQHHQPTLFAPPTITEFTNNLCLPSDDVAELEWLSRFVDDSFTDFPTTNICGGGGSGSFRPSNNSLQFSGRIKRSKWAGPKRQPSEASPPRRCAHCLSENTPQWRAGPMGPKTLCNACGVRYKSGRLVPEYRPAASPTFVLTQHSNSHRKVMELRRQKGSFSAAATT